MADSDSLIASSGGDYTSIQAWVDAKDGETGTHIGRLANEVFNGSCTINNGSTAATAFILRPNTGARHDGRSRDVSGTGAQVTRTGTASPAIWWFNSNGATLTVEDINVKGGTSQALFSFYAGAAATVQRCVLQPATSGTGITTSGANSNLRVTDNIVYGAGIGIDYRNSGNSAGEISGNTVHTSANYGILPGSAAVVRNNISVGAATACYFGSDVGDTQHGNNIASDATADTEWNGGGGGYNSLQVHDTGDTPTGHYVAFVSIGSGTEDYHLVDLGHGTYVNRALGNGATGYGSGYDIDNEARDGSAPNIGADDPSAGGAFTLTATQQSYTLTGQASGLLAARTLTATQQSYALTGQDAGLSYGRTLTADQASFTLTGQDASLLAARKITADQQTYTLTGNAAALLAGRLLTATQQSYVLTGIGATLTYTPAGSYLLSADAGLFTLSGQDANLLYARVMGAAHATFTLTGKDADLTTGTGLAGKPIRRRRRFLYQPVEDLTKAEVKQLYREAKKDIPETVQLGLLNEAPQLFRGRRESTLPPISRLSISRLQAEVELLKALQLALQEQERLRDARAEAEYRDALLAQIQKSYEEETARQARAKAQRDQDDEDEEAIINLLLM